LKNGLKLKNKKTMGDKKIDLKTELEKVIQYGKKEKKITLAEISQVLGVAISTIWRYRKGKTEISVGLYEQIVNYILSK